jgi:hypothetical protein
VGLGASLTGLPGEPVAVAGLAFAGGSGVLATGGLIVKGAGAILLSIAGNSQPLQVTAAQVTQNALEDTVHLPPGMPSPIGPAIENDLDNMEAGSNPCP